MKTLNVALIGGPAYDVLYTRLPEFERETGYHVNVAFNAPHPQLNERLAREYGEGAPAYDLLSTHTKYAPSQAEWLLPLDEWYPASEQEKFFPLVADLARIGGRFMQVPRNLDVRLLHYRSDLFQQAGAAAPPTWDEFRALARHFTKPPRIYGTTFPGRHSGLFGTWYELLVMAGGRLFDENLRPSFVGEAGEWALNLLHQLYDVDHVTPSDLPAGHYEEVNALFRAGKAAMILEWPGYYGTLRDATQSAVVGRFGVARYPLGPAGVRRGYSGGHSFAIPTSVRDREGAVALLRFLTSHESQVLEGEAGSIVPRLSAWEEVKRRCAHSEFDTHRLELLEVTMREDLLIPPKFARYPAVEDALWKSLQAGVTGHLTVRGALRRAQKQVSEILERKSQAV